MATPEYPLRISPGTQVVVGSRRTGVVVEIVDGDPVAYRVRYPTGDEAVLGRDQLRIRKQAQQAALGPARDPAALMGELLDGWVVYRCVTGSQAYGIADDGSDVDIRGVFVAPAELLWSLQGAPKWKHVMHLIRLLLSGISVLREGAVTVDVGDHRDRLLAIKRGEVPWEDVELRALRARVGDAWVDVAPPPSNRFSGQNPLLLVQPRGNSTRVIHWVTRSGSAA